MTRSLPRIVTLTLLGVLLIGSSATGQTPQDIVNQFYPTDRLRPATMDDRRSCYAIFSTLPSGEPAVIVAGYSDTASAVLRVLGVDQNGSFQALRDSTVTLYGIDCTIKLVDLDSNSPPEILLEFSGVKGSAMWVFRWTGVDLFNLTAMNNGSVASSLLTNAAISDLYHDGTLQLVAFDGERPSQTDGRYETANEVFRLGSTGYEHDKYIVAYSQYGVTVDPRVNVTTFALIADSVGPYTLRVVNGDRQGNHRVTSGSIRVNGAEIISSSQLNATTEFVTTVLTSLPANNRVEAILTGDEGAIITLVVEDSTTRP
jgi:hypothetical protein